MGQDFYLSSTAFQTLFEHEPYNLHEEYFHYVLNVLISGRYLRTPQRRGSLNFLANPGFHSGHFIKEK